MNFSVLTTSYNYEQYIRETIESVLNQTYKDFEYIIIDDCSTDNSVNIIKDYAKNDSRIKFFTSPQKNQGLIKTFYDGINKCNGDYIIFVESDDTISPNYIEEKIKVINKYPEAAVIFNQINPTDNKIRIDKMNKHLEKTKKLINMESFDFYNLFAINIIPTFSCAMAKKNNI